MSFPTPSTVPTGWQEQTSRSAGNENFRYLELNGLAVKYVGEGADERFAVSVRANQPVPADVAIFYFEMEVIDKGRDGFIGVGLAAGNVKADRLPGWEPHSYGYHGDDGHKFSGSGSGTSYGPTFTTGDVVGVVYNRAERTLSYTKNGIDLGIAFRDIQEERLYPVVGLRTPGEQVLVRFKAPFRHDISSLVQDVKAKATSAVVATPLPSSAQKSTLFGQLVYQHLLREGYATTAMTVAREVLGGAQQLSETDLQQMSARQRISSAVMEGRIDEALTLTEELAPGCLDRHPNLRFSMQCQAFVELARHKRVDEALQLGQNYLGPYRERHATKEEKAFLEEVLTLIAWEDPEHSPTAHLLQRPHNAHLASQLNSVLLEHFGQPKASALEVMYKQTLALHKELLAVHDPMAALVEPMVLLQGAGGPQQVDMGKHA